MANWQDIKVLEECIYDAVQEYLDNSEAYNNAVLHVFLDYDEMTHKAEIEENIEINEDNGIYSIDSLIRICNDGREPDIDRISDIANSWIFLN